LAMQQWVWLKIKIHNPAQCPTLLKTEVVTFVHAYFKMEPKLEIFFIAHMHAHTHTHTHIYINKTAGPSGHTV
jgi:hypothetical protein